LKRRNLTLRNIASTIVEFQQEYLQRGVAHLKPLTLADIAAHLGISESTVSRALEGKYVQMPTGRVVSFDLFFDASLPIKEQIRRILEREDPDRPLTDRSIAFALRREGIRIARRTAAKYREEMGVPPSVARRGKDPAGGDAPRLRRGAARSG
jgi:RNA polymerase sigma-54 factor